jgi:hypothetical protein
MLFRQRESFHVHDSSKKCVTVYANGNFNNGKSEYASLLDDSSSFRAHCCVHLSAAVYIEPEWTLRDFLLAASQRLDTGWIASRLFNSDGTHTCLVECVCFIANSSCLLEHMYAYPQGPRWMIV